MPFMSKTMSETLSMVCTTQSTHSQPARDLPLWDASQPQMLLEWPTVVVCSRAGGGAAAAGLWLGPYPTLAVEGGQSRGVLATVAAQVHACFLSVLFASERQSI